MPEPTQTPHDSAQNSASSKSADGARAGERGVESERRSFQSADTLARKSADGGQTLAREAGQRLNEAARQPAHDAADFWRASLESVSTMQMELRQMVDEAWRMAIGMGPRAPMLTAYPFASGIPSFLGQPASDMRETEDAYLLTVELPGLSRADVDLTLRDDVMSVCGAKAEESERTTAAYRISERRFGRFERSFPIPRDVDRSRIEASVRDGVLKVVLPRHSKAPKQSWKIEVKG